MVGIKNQNLNRMLFFIILISIFSSFAYAIENETYVEFNPTTISSDDTYYSSLFVRNVSDLVVFSLNVSWDFSVINITHVNTSSTFSDFDSVFFSLDNEKGHLSVNAYRFGDEGLSGDVSVLRLSIIAVEPLKDGSVSGLIISDDSVMYDSDQGFIDHSIKSGNIKIKTNEFYNKSINNSILYLISFIIIIFFIFIIIKILKK